jgi:hypothetical protein
MVLRAAVHHRHIEHYYQLASFIQPELHGLVFGVNVTN